MYASVSFLCFFYCQDRFHARVDLRNLRLDEPLQDLGCKNTDSLGKLLQGFLNYYAFTFRSGSSLVRCSGILIHSDVYNYTEVRLTVE